MTGLISSERFTLTAKLEAFAEGHSRWLMAVALGAILLIHLGNALIPAVDYDEASFVNVAATLATLGEYGNTWQFGRLTVPDRFASIGPPILFPAALFWKLGIQSAVGIRLAVMTPFFVGFLLLFSRVLADFDWEARLWTLVLWFGLPGWGLYSARVVGEFPALCFACAGVLLVTRQRFLPAGLSWGLAGLCKLVFLPGLVLGWALFCWHTKKGWRPILWVGTAAAVPIVFFLAWLRIRYSVPSDLAFSLQAGSAAFYPRNLPLNLTNLNNYMPIILVALGYAFCWVERRTMPKVFLLGCLSSFWCLWHLVGQRGWLRYALPGLVLLLPTVGAALCSIRRGKLPGYVTLAAFAAMATFSFVGLYENTYSIWTSYKTWRDQSRVIRYLRAHPDRRVLGEGWCSPYPEYLWLSGIRFQDVRSVQPSPGDIVVLSDGNSFLRREMAAGTIGTWKWVLSTTQWSRVFTTPPLDIYEKR